MKRSLVAVALLGLSFAGVASAQAFVNPKEWSVTNPSEAKKGGTYRTSALNDYKTLNPFTTAESGNIPQTITSAGGFFTYDPAKGEYVPYMAASYTVSKDKLVWTMNIRKGMKWSDGKPIVADDWVTTFKIHTDEDVGSNSYDSFFIDDKPIKIEKVDEDTVRAVFPKVKADAIETLTYDPFPNHIFGPVYASKGAAGIKAMWTLNTPGAQIVQSGAFKFVSYAPGERAVFERNAAYGEWNKDSAGNALPYMDGRNITIFKDLNALFNAFLGGQLDTYAPRNADDLAQIKRRADSGDLKAVLRANLGPATSSSWIVFNWNRKSDPFKQATFRDDNFRRAMSHITNRAAMIDIALGGLGAPAYSSVYAAYTQWIPSDLKKFDYNLEAAKSLLAKAGFTKKNGDGILVNREGKALEFDLTTNAGNTTREQLAKIFVDEAKKVGVKVNFKPIDFNTLVQQLLQDGDDRKFDGLLLGLSGGGLIYPLGENVEPCGTNLHAFNKSGKCLAAWETQVTALFTRGQQELDNAKRIAIAKQIQTIQSNYQAWVYLVSPNVHAAWVSRVRGEYPQPIQSSVNGTRSLDLTWIAQ
jgi:peptide/nickel transport system substrate-binding protein